MAFYFHFGKRENQILIPSFNSHGIVAKASAPRKQADKASFQSGASSSRSELIKANSLLQKKQRVPYKAISANTVVKKVSSDIIVHNSMQAEKLNAPNTDMGVTEASEQAELDLLDSIAKSARQLGSKVAYIGEVAELAAFDPHFFKTEVDENGHAYTQVNRVDQIVLTQTPQGPAQMNLERLPYPIPPGESTRYQYIKGAIMLATQEGAMLINLTTPAVNLAQLASAIDYARSRGVAVVAVSPQARRK